MKKALFSIVLAWISLHVSGQSISTQGKEFWLSFMQNGYYENNWGSINGMIAQITISAKNDCEVSVSHPLYPTQTFPVEANSIYTVPLPSAETFCYHNADDNETVVSKGLHITATDTISVYCANIANNSFDASFVLPLESLGDEYIVQCGEQSSLTNIEQYKRNNQTSAFLIVATEDNTIVEITPTVNTLGGHQANVPFSVTLNAGQTYHVRSNNTATTSAGRDLSGTHVTASDCKRIAVFAGNTLTRLPVTLSGQSGFDHIFEQVMPLRSWGKKFVVTQSMTRNRDIVKVVSASDGNVIRKNGDVVATLYAHQTHVFDLSKAEASCYIEATHPCAVYLYNTSADDGKANGDPSMVWIAPVEQKIKEVSFATFTQQNASIDYHYVNIIVSTDDKDKVRLDGNLLPPGSFDPVNGNPDYCFARKSISHGTHRIACANGFNAHVYGFGDAKGYAYLVGSNAIDLSVSPIINGQVVHGGEVFDCCYGDNLEFNAEINYSDCTASWNFGDGTTSSTPYATHSYTEEGEHKVVLKVEINESQCQASSTDSVVFYVSVHPEVHNPLMDMVCWAGQPDLYINHGFTIPYSQPGVYHDTIRTVTQYGCDSIATMRLEVESGFHEDQGIVELCESFTWDITGETVNTLGTHPLHHNFKDDGLSFCDSIYEIVVIIKETGHYDPVSINNPYCDSVPYVQPWIDTVLFQNGIHTLKGISENGCEIEQEVTISGLSFTPSPRIANSDSVVYNDGDTLAVVTHTEFFSFQYDFVAEDSLGHISDWDSCVWTISKDSWRIHATPDESPVKTNCRVFVAEHDDLPVRLTCTIYNSHCEPYCIVRHLYLKSSFFGIGEEDTGKAIFSVVPNPNSGEMELRLEHLNGKATIKVYDMRGILIDEIETYNPSGTLSLPYRLKARTDGIYYFVATAQEGSLARKVIVTK